MTFEHRNDQGGGRVGERDDILALTTKAMFGTRARILIKCMEVEDASRQIQ